MVFCSALDLVCVLKNEKTVISVKIYHRVNHGVGQRGFTGAGAADNKNIFSLPDGHLQHVKLWLGQNVVAQVIVQGEYPGGLFPDGK